MKIRLFLIFLLLTGVSFARPYMPPNMEKEIFNEKKLSLDKISKTALFEGLLSVARDFDNEEDEVDYVLRSNALAIAGRLDPQSETFKDVLQDLEDWGVTVKEKAERSHVSSKIYRRVRALMLMREKGNKDDEKCAAYCIDIALRLDPDGENADELKSYQEEVGDADWKGMLEAPVFQKFGGRQLNQFKKREESIPGGDAKKFAAIRRTLYGLSFRTLSNGGQAGSAASLSAIALRDKNTKGIKFHIDQKVGNMTGKSLEEVLKLMRVRHEVAGRNPSGYNVEITFEDSDTLLDGPSTGLAMSIILDSLFTGRQLDDKFACTGAINADGKVAPIGGVAGKIRGAGKKGCHLVGVPHENIEGVSDILVLDGIDKLIAIQVFSFKTLDEALMVASKNKPPDVQSAIDDFSKVAELIKSKGESALAHPKVIGLLEDVVTKMPNHQSAQILLSAAKKEEKKILSLGGSFYHIRTNTSGISRSFQSKILSGDFEISAGDKAEAKDAHKALKELASKLDPRLKDYNDEMLEALEVHSEGRRDGEKNDVFAKRLKKEWKEVKDARALLMGGGL